MEKKKIGILFDNHNSKHKKIHTEIVEKYNPGLGGTEFLVLMLYRAIKKYSLEFDAFLFVTGDTILDDDVIYVKQDDIATQVVNKNIDILVYTQKKNDRQLIESCEQMGIKLIAWVHNFIPYFKINELYNNAVKRVVFVGHQHYDCYIDDEIINKSQYIYNMVVKTEHTYINPKDKENIVSYVGGIYPVKGFHKLARVWKYILKEVPNAKLYVLGSGNLYNSSANLGEYGVADKKYEDKFIKYLLDENGNIDKSVNFLGVVSDKKEIMTKVKVGVANPTGKSETFCLSAVEYKGFGIPVVSYRGYGLLDTVNNNFDGILTKSDRELKNAIVNLLKNNDLNKKIGYNGYMYGTEKFYPENIIKDWEDLFRDVINGVPANIEIPNNFLEDDFKWLKLINYKIKKVTGFKWWSVAYFISYVKDKVKLLLEK